MWLVTFSTTSRPSYHSNSGPGTPSLMVMALPRSPAISNACSRIPRSKTNADCPSAGSDRVTAVFLAHAGIKASKARTAPAAPAYLKNCRRPGRCLCSMSVLLPRLKKIETGPWHLLLRRSAPTNFIRFRSSPDTLKCTNHARTPERSWPGAPSAASDPFTSARRSRWVRSRLTGHSRIGS